MKHAFIQNSLYALDIVRWRFANPEIYTLQDLMLWWHWIFEESEFNHSLEESLGKHYGQIVARW